MANNARPRRMSMAYVLGLSDTPFKDPKPPPKPPKPNQYAQMASTPGAVIEWVASNGRKGRLSSKGRSLTAQNLKDVSSKPILVDGEVNRPSSVKAGSKKAASANNDALGALGGLGDALANLTGGTEAVINDTAQNFGTTGNELSNDSNDVEYKKDVPNPFSFTEDQDKLLMKLKNTDGSMPWAKIAEQVGKEHSHCKQRFGQIKPDNWRPTPKEGKKGKGKDSNQNKQEKQSDEKKDDSASNEHSKNNENSWEGLEFNTDQANNSGEGANADAWGGGAWGDDNAAKTDSGQNNWNSFEQVDNKSEHKSQTGGDQFDESWGQNATTGANEAEWNAANSQAENAVDGTQNIPWGSNENDKSSDKKSSKSNDAAAAVGGWDSFGADAWGGAPSAPKAPSKHSDKSSSKHHHKHSTQSHSSSKHMHKRSSRSYAGSNNRLECKVSPDETFSQQDLRLIARLMQQDCGMVWQRVAWRFRDKTGRNVHPDVFEKKITGQDSKERRH